MSWLAILLVLLSASIHAIWNLLSHSRKVNAALLLRFHWLTGLAGFIPLMFFELRGSSLPPTVWGLVILSSIFQAFYFLGLMMGYRHGNFSVVYPVARALPILFLAFFDIARGRFPTLMGWLGILFVIIGCVIIPLESLSTIKLADYWNRSTIWILVIMFATVSYTSTDKVAAELLTIGAGTAARYALLQAIFTVPFLWIIFKVIKEPIEVNKGEEVWKWSIVLAIFVFSSYWLMLWAYQLAAYISYLSALRQFSLVIGVVLAALFFNEEVPFLRIIGVIILIAGMFCISQT